MGTPLNISVHENVHWYGSPPFYVGTGKKAKCFDLLPQDLSEISGSDGEDIFPQITINRNTSERYCKSKKRKDPVIIHIGKHKESSQSKKKTHRIKKKLMPKVAYSSEESDDEYRNKRRKLANAVSVHTPKSDTTTLRARLKKMFGMQSAEPVKISVCEKPKQEITYDNLSVNVIKQSKDTQDTKPPEVPTQISEKILSTETKACELIDLCNENTNDDDVTIVNNEENSYDVVDAVERKDSVEAKVSSGDSDEDLELLRQHALKTKANKAKVETTNTELTEKEKEEELEKQLLASEDEDSDTEELRMICLKSALLKKAIEMKQKQKMRKRMSQTIHDDFCLDDELSQKLEAENNTDVELVDMDIGSDGDEKLKELSDNCDLNIKHVTEFKQDLNIITNIPIPKSPQKDEIDEDEDLLRAKLLTSLSKNWRNLVEPPVIEQLPDAPSPDVPPTTAKSKINLPVEKPFIIKLGESDSEGEHEATKNLTKMHIKLSEQVDFQQKLDMFLKSTRMEVEKTTLPDVVQQPTDQPKPVPKYVPKTVRHLPKSEQIEYKNLVKRMAELEKIKQARQSSMNMMKASVPAKETLKPRNISTDPSDNNNNLEEQIALSRKNIAEESAKMLKLKDEAVKLSRKYKIVATELRNITTAITFNKKEQRSVQSRLTKIRLHHQNLLKSSTSSKHSINNVPLSIRNSNKHMSTTKLQKENDPSKEEYKNPQLLKSVKVSIVNNLKEDSVTKPRLSVQVDVSSNKKIVKLPKSPSNERIVDIASVDESVNVIEEINRILGRDGEEIIENQENERHAENRLELHPKELDDYKSPLEALQTGNWEEDPNSFLCPFEVGGSCKDPDCKYLHPKVPSEQ